jgi:hypothetical protein
VSGGFSSEVYDSAGDVDQQASFEEAGFAGSAPGAMSFDGQSFTVTFQNPHLAGLDLRCVELRSGPDVEEPFADSFYLGGYGPRSLTPTTAQAAWVQLLATRGYSNAAHRYAACPREEIGIGGPNSALCWAEFKTSQTWRRLSGAVTGPAAEASRNELQPPLGAQAAPLAAALPPPDPSGSLASNDGACEALLASDVAYALKHHNGSSTSTSTARTPPASPRFSATAAANEAARSRAPTGKATRSAIRPDEPTVRHAGR